MTRLRQASTASILANTHTHKYLLISGIQYYDCKYPQAPSFVSCRVDWVAEKGFN